MSEYDHSTGIQLLLDRLPGDGDTVRAALIERAYDRICRLARRMFRRFPLLRSAVETDDVLQGAALRLHRSLPEVCPASVRQFFGLAAGQIRRELIDLTRRHLGPGGAKAGAVAFLGGPSSTGFHPLLLRQRAPADEPETLAEWAEFHAAVGRLPEEERETFDLLWYQGLSQPEAAQLLGVSPRTVKRRWRTARLRLHALLGGAVPGM